MADKSWMLHPLAIRHARECIVIIKRDFDVALKMSDPDFLELLHDKVALGASRDLSKAYAKLVADAGVGKVMQALGSAPARPVVAAR
ncbi:hypothetical protein [Simiduia aestuariiviva]|uniref:Uncharacterized protein n=1 Tax=Simiduia aestuariiviva TaxID=1510459 RepID=A0A839UIA8_9GAMM|nr:hypothetical protein [Simiduia aestuariiviva]MBB3167794.1 hypothetical protein [Simiduia aestuariiviva]